MTATQPKRLRVLVACEYSGVVRDWFTTLGHDAISCDLLPSERPNGKHHQGDVLDLITARPDGYFDLMIAHPSCQYLANSGAKHLYIEKTDEDGKKYRSQERDPARWAAMEEAAEFYRLLWDASIEKIAIENPIMVGHARRLIGIDQKRHFVQPWQFGHGECKATGFDLRGLSPLIPTNIVEGRSQNVHRMSPGPDRWRDRSRTFEGIGEAMARQWGGDAR